MVKDRLKELRQEMSKRGIDIYIVPTADFHESEYVGEHFKARKQDLQVQQEQQSSQWRKQDSGPTEDISYRQQSN